MDRTILMFKPDAYERGLRDEIMKELRERVRFSILARKYKWLTDEEIEIIYGHNKGKEFWEDFVRYMKRRPVEMFLLQGKDVMERMNEVIGPTRPEDDPEKKTIRGKYGIPTYLQKGKHIENLLHSSYDKKSYEVEKEVMLWWRKEYTV